VYDTLTAGGINENIDVTIYTTATEGTEVVNLRVASMGNPSLRDSINVYVTVQSGVEEKDRFINKEIQDPVLQIYPNPFHNNLCITFSTDCNAKNESLKIYNASGRLVKSFNHLANYQSPFNQIIWRGDDDFGHKVSKGIYFIHLKTDNFKKTGKVIKIE